MRLSTFAARLRPPLQALIRENVVRILEERRTAWRQVEEEAARLRASLEASRRGVEADLQRLDRSPLNAQSTVHAAHRRHPGVQAVFARHGLPRCLDCAVGADETLAEAAFGEDFPLSPLLQELNALLLGRVEPP